MSLILEAAIRRTPHVARIANEAAVATAPLSLKCLQKSEVAALSSWLRPKLRRLRRKTRSCWNRTVVAGVM
jgi:hypothetical protein